MTTNEALTSFLIILCLCLVFFCLFMVVTCFYSSFCLFVVILCLLTELCDLQTRNINTHVIHRPRGSLIKPIGLRQAGPFSNPSMELGSGHSDFRLEQHQQQNTAEAATKAEQLYTLFQQLGGGAMPIFQPPLEKLEAKFQSETPHSSLAATLTMAWNVQLLQSHISTKKDEVSTLT